MTTVSAIPDFPAVGESGFNTKAYTWATHIADTTVGEINTVAGEVNTNAGEASNNAWYAYVSATNASAYSGDAAASASNAAASSGVTKWVSGTTYAEGVCTWSPTDYQTYRRKSAGGGTTDPNADSTNWAKISTQGGYGVLHVRDEKASGTGAGDSVLGTTYTRTLNTVKTNTISGASLAANTITLPAGTYDMRATVSRSMTSGQAFLYNSNDASTLIVGPSVASDDGVNFITGRFTLATTNGVQVKQYAGKTTANGLGAPLSSGLGEVYTEVWIERIS